jgi:hypothetical protein
MEHYLKAYTIRPTRAEPLIRIAMHYHDEDQLDLSYIFAQRAAQIPYPKDDILMIERELYDAARWEILNACASCAKGVTE